jgi:hypothetical protein
MFKANQCESIMLPLIASIAMDQKGVFVASSFGSVGA